MASLSYAHAVAIKLILAPWRDRTSANYNSAWRKWEKRILDVKFLSKLGGNEELTLKKFT